MRTSITGFGFLDRSLCVRGLYTDASDRDLRLSAFAAAAHQLQQH